MENRRYRVLVFDDDESMRKMMWHYFDSRGYEVFTFPHPQSCPICEIASCTCPLNESCSDLIISDLDMPFVKGIDFLEKQLAKGCKVKNIALMSGDLTPDAHQRAESLGIKVFKKPFGLKEIDQWVNEAEREIPTNRKLADWFLKGR